MSGVTVGITTRLLIVTVLALVPIFVYEAGRITDPNFLAVCAVSLGVATLGVYLLTRQLDNSLGRLQRATEKFASGDLDYRVYPSRIPQLVGLAKGLNAMGTQLKQRVTALIALTDEQDTILRSMVEGVLTVSSDGKIMRCNKAARGLLQLSDEANIGRSIPEVIRHVELQKFMLEVIGDLSVTTRSLSIWNESEQNHLDVTASPLSSPEGLSSGMLFVLHDVTKVRRLEQVRTDFVGNVSHELRTPITSIKGFVETLLDGAADDPDHGKGFLQIISRHADRLAAIVNDLLTLSKLEASAGEVDLDFSKTSVQELIEDVAERVSPAAQEKQIKVEIETSDDIVAIVNSSLLEQAIFNLVDNAIKHTEGGGVVSIKKILHDDLVLVVVKDTGCGIEKSHLPRLFERFYRVDQGRSRKAGGTGLGLSIVKHIAQVHGGTAEADSVVGRGSTFTISFKRKPLGSSLSV